MPKTSGKRNRNKKSSTKKSTKKKSSKQTSKNTQPENIPSNNDAPKSSKSETEKRTKKHSHGFSIYIRRLLNSLNESSQISEKVSKQMNKILIIIVNRVVEIARNECISKGKKTMSPSEIKVALRVIFPEDIYTEAINSAKEAMTRFFNAIVESTEKSTRREARAEIIFPVALVENFCRQNGSSKLALKEATPIFTAAALEYFASEILEAAIYQVSEDKKVILTPRHMYLAIQNDESLQYVFDQLQIRLMGSGTYPFIHPELIPSEEKKKANAARRRKARKDNNNNTKGTNGTRRSRPGTKALSDIREQQKSVKILLQQQPFHRVIRNYAGERIPRFSDNGLTSLQTFVEQCLVNLFRDAQELALHANRETVFSSDLTLAWKMTYGKNFPRYNPTEEENFDKTTNNGIQRIAHRGGAKRVGKNVYDEARVLMFSMIKRIIDSSVVFLQERNVITLKNNYLETCLHHLGYNFVSVY